MVRSTVRSVVGTGDAVKVSVTSLPSSISSGVAVSWMTGFGAPAAGRRALPNPPVDGAGSMENATVLALPTE